MKTTLRLSIIMALLLAPVMTAIAASKPAATEHFSNPTVVKMSPDMTTASLASHADHDLVELSSGKRLPVGDLRRLESIGQKMRQPGKPLSPALTAKPAATGIPMKQRGDLQAALKRPDSDTIQLPSGKRLTVGQLRLLKPEIEKQLGRSLDAVPARQVPTGPATKLQPGMTAPAWKALFQQPDSTILESPSGKRITVGELKQVLTIGRSSMPKAPLTGKGGKP